jgi:hypothetical protein
VAFAIDLDKPDHKNYEVTGANDQVVTSSARQDELAKAGFQFEACVSQAAMIEALCMHYLMLLKKVRGKTIQPKLQAKLSEGRITFGQLKDAIGYTKMLEPEDLKHNRNTLMIAIGSHTI